MGWDDVINTAHVSIYRLSLATASRVYMQEKVCVGRGIRILLHSHLCIPGVVLSQNGLRLHAFLLVSMQAMQSAPNAGADSRQQPQHRPL